MGRHKRTKKTAERALGGQSDRSTKAAVSVYAHHTTFFLPMSTPTRLATIARLRADRDLAVAEACKIAGDRSGFCLHRRRGLKHQAVWLALRGAGA